MIQSVVAQMSPLLPLLVLAWHSRAHERCVFELCVLCACSLDGSNSVPLLVLATAVPCTYAMHGWGVRPWVRTVVVLCGFVYLACAATYAEGESLVAMELVFLLCHLCGYVCLMEPWILVAHRQAVTPAQLVLLVVAALGMLAVLVAGLLLALLGVEKQAWATCEMLAVALAVHLSPHEPFLRADRADAQYLPVQLPVTQVDLDVSDEEHSI